VENIVATALFWKGLAPLDRGLEWILTSARMPPPARHPSSESFTFAGPLAIAGSPTPPLSASGSMSIPSRASAGAVSGSGGVDAGPMSGECGGRYGRLTRESCCRNEAERSCSRRAGQSLAVGKIHLTRYARTAYLCTEMSLLR
jgi:hypothetical protein